VDNNDSRTIILMWCGVVPRPACGGFWRRQATACVTFLLILLSFLVILSAQSAQQRFLKLVPTEDMCATTLPTLHFGSASLFAAAQANASKSIRLERPDTFGRVSADASCGAGKYFASYLDTPGITFDVEACSSDFRTTARDADVSGE